MVKSEFDDCFQNGNYDALRPYLFDNSERLFFGFFDAFVSYAAVTATFFPVSLILHHAHTIKQLIPAAFNFFSVFSAFLRSV